MRQLKSKLLQHLPKSLIVLISSLNQMRKGQTLATHRKLIDQENRVRLSTELLLQQYDGVVGTLQGRKSRINQYEFGLFSQNGEDGILLHIFSQIGVTNQRFVEFGIGDGRQCNSALLTLRYGWGGLLMDAVVENVSKAQAYYAQALKDDKQRIQIGCHAITAGNINSILQSYRVGGEIDMLSIDIDSNDYWVWQAIDVIQPRVVVMEYNATFGATESVTVPYNPNFHQIYEKVTGMYHGASLSALEKLGKKKGYRLIGCDSMGVNAFFVRNDIGVDKLPTVTAADAYYPSAIRGVQLSIDEQRSLLDSLPTQQV